MGVVVELERKGCSIILFNFYNMLYLALVIIISYYFELDGDGKLIA
jgi:hypothetical protein